MNLTQDQLLITVCETMRTEGKYCIIPGQQAMRNNLRHYHKKDIAESTYYNDMGYLEKVGLLERGRRYSQKAKPLIRRQPAMLSFTAKGLTYLKNKGNAYAHRLWQSICEYRARERAKLAGTKFIKSPERNTAQLYASGLQHVQEILYTFFREQEVLCEA